MHPYLIICELCELCEQMCRLSIFLRKVSIFSGKVAKRNSAKYKPPGNLIETIANAAVERGSQGGHRTEIVSPANEQYENRSKLLRYHYKQEPLRM